MDPMTVAAKRFIAQLESAWAASPSAANAPGPRAVRLVADPAEHSGVLKALRWLEWSSASTRPVVLFEAPFANEPQWLRELVAKVADDCEAVRTKLAETGMTLPPAATRPADTTLDAVTAARYLDAAAKSLVTEALDGLVIALVPRQVTDPTAYRAAIAKIAAPGGDGALRLVVLDVRGADLDALLPDEAHFVLDRAALLAFLKQLGPRLSEGPAGPKPRWPLVTNEVGTPGPSQATHAALRARLLDAGEALSEGKAKLAVAHFQSAHRLCQENAMRTEECATGIGLGSAYLAAGDETAALATYEQAMERAVAGGLSMLAAQAMLGAAGIHFGMARYAEARRAYETIARLTVEVPPLAQAAERMQRQCRDRERMTAKDPKDHALDGVDGVDGVAMEDAR